MYTLVLYKSAYCLRIMIFYSLSQAGLLECPILNILYCSAYAVTTQAARIYGHH